MDVGETYSELFYGGGGFETGGNKSCYKGSVLQTGGKDLASKYGLNEEATQ